MEKLAQQLSIRAGGHRFEKISPYNFYSIMGDRFYPQVRLIKKDASRRERRVEDRNKLCPDAAADIGDHGKLTPRIGRRDGRCHGLTCRFHRPIRRCVSYWITSQMFPIVATVELFGRRLFSGQSIPQLIPSVVGEISL